MKLTLFKILFGPVLLLQAAIVKHRTPRLPEPVLDKQGQEGVGKELKLLLLGDSSAAGVGALSSKDSLLGQLIQLLSQEHCLQYQMVAETGKTTAGAIQNVEALPWQKFDVIITALGVNDVTSQVSTKVWRQQQNTLLQMLKDKFQPSKIIVSGLPPMGDFPALPWPLNRYLGAYADTFNQLLIELTAGDSQLYFHSLRAYPEQAKTATDGFHPGPVAYQLWAQKLTDTIVKYNCQLK